MNDSPEEHRIRHLPVEPNVFIGREEPGKFWANDTDNVAQHGKKNETTIVRQNKTRSARSPNRKLKGIETSKSLVGLLSMAVEY